MLLVNILNIRHNVSIFVSVHLHFSLALCSKETVKSIDAYRINVKVQNTTTKSRSQL